METNDPPSPIAGFITVCFFLWIMCLVAMVVYALVGLVFPPFITAILAFAIVAFVGVFVWASFSR